MNIESAWIAIRPFLVYDLAPLLVAYFVAYIVHRLSPILARQLVPIGTVARHGLSYKQNQARMQTMHNLLSATISFIAFLVATVVALSRFVGVDSLIWMIGLFGAGIGFSAKPFIADLMTGIMFITEDIFVVGEKVVVFGEEGVVEKINLRTTHLRGLDGELYIIPNGEIRAVRNFSRASYTPIKLTVRVPSHKLETSIRKLEALGQRANEIHPELIEPWMVLAESGHLDDHTDLTLAAKATFGKGAHLRPHLLALVQRELQEAEVISVPAESPEPAAVPV